MAALTRSLDAAVGRGLADAAEALLGDDPAPVCSALRKRRDAGAPPLPWLAGACFSALAPLGYQAPAEPEVKAVERLLAGAPLEQPAALAAIRSCRAARWRGRGDDGDGDGDGDGAAALWRRTLVGAVDDAFARVVAGYASLRRALLDDSETSLEHAATRAGEPIAVAAARVEELAAYVATTQPDVVTRARLGGAVPAEPDARREGASAAPTLRLARTPPVPPWPGRRSGEPVDDEEPPPQLPREAAWPAIVFVTVAVALACGLLWLVVDAGV